MKASGAVKNSVALIVIVGVVGGIFWYTAAQTSLGTAAALVGVLAVFVLVIAGMVVVGEALTRKFPRLEQPVVPPMSVRAERKVGLIWSLAVLVIMALGIYDPPRIDSKSPTSALGASIFWHIHDLLGLAPHDWRTWEKRSDALQAKLAKARASAPKAIHSLVARGRDLESAKYLVASDLRKLAHEAAAARDSVAVYRFASLERYLDAVSQRP